MSGEVDRTAAQSGPTDLAPMPPAEAVSLYLDHRENEFREATYDNNQRALEFFVQWTEEAGIESMHELTGRELLEFKSWRSGVNEMNQVSLAGTLSIIKKFLKFCAKIEAVEPGLPEKVPMPNVSDDDGVRTDVPSDAYVSELRSYGKKYEYATGPRLVLELSMVGPLRLGGIRALDLDDIDVENNVIRLRHRVEDGSGDKTPLKNGLDGQRNLTLPDPLMEEIQDYCASAGERQDVTTEAGREPLFTTASGRAANNTIRRWVYKLSRPCTFGDACPEDRDPQQCDAAQFARKASKCPANFSLHPFRKWGIMHLLSEGVRIETVSNRADVSVEVLKRHYDHRTLEDRREDRRQELEQKVPGY